MTPMAGTRLGYLLIGVAAILSLYIIYTWNRAESPTEESIASSPPIRKSSGAMVAVLSPSILLVIMAVIWSYYGGLPAMKSDPATFVQFRAVTLQSDWPIFQPNQSTAMNVWIRNGPQIALDVTWDAKVLVIPISNAAYEDKFYQDFRQSSVRNSTGDMMPGTSQYHTFETSPLTSRDVDDVHSGRKRLYVFGYIKYRDAHGIEQEVEMCQHLLDPGHITAEQEASYWALCESHNKVRSK